MVLPLLNVTTDGKDNTLYDILVIPLFKSFVKFPDQFIVNKTYTLFCGSKNDVLRGIKHRFIHCSTSLSFLRLYSHQVTRVYAWCNVSSFIPPMKLLTSLDESTFIGKWEYKLSIMALNFDIYARKHALV